MQIGSSLNKDVILSVFIVTKMGTSKDIEKNIWMPSIRVK